VRCTERRDGNHRPVGTPYEEEVQVVAVSPIRRVGLNIYTVYTVEHIEVIDVDRTRERFHRREDVGHRNPDQLRFVAIHVEIKLRNVGLHRRGQPRKLGPLLGIVHQRIHRPLQIGIAGIPASFEHHFETARGSQTGNDGRRRKIDLAFGITRQLVTHTFHHFADILRFPLLPGLEDHCQLAAGLVAAHTRTRTRHVEYILHIGILHQKGHRPVGHRTRTLDGRPFRKFQFDGEIPLILLRHETFGHEFIHQPDTDEYHAEGGEHTARMGERPADHTAVELIAFRKTEIDIPEKPFLPAASVGLQQVGAHHGAERQRHDRRDDYRYGDRNGKLAIELPRNARKEAHRDEHGAQHQRHGDQRSAQAPHRLLGRFVGRKPLLVHDAIDVFDHDDRVIDHDTDGKNQTQQGQHIEREAEHEHHAEGTDERDRHGHDRNERRPPALQRKEYHQNHQQQRFEKRLIDVMD